MKSVLLPFFVNLELEAYTKTERRDIIRLVTEYLLGCKRFNATKKALAQYECQTEFQHTLRDLTPEYHRYYRRTLRRYAQGKDIRIHDFDKYHLKHLDLSAYPVKVLAYPTENEVVRSMSFTINAKAFKLRQNRKVVRMTHYGIDDLKQIMFLRILAAYRTYLPSVGRCLPLKAFYSVLHCALSSSIIDKIREFDSNKAQVTVPFALLGEDFESGIDASYYSSGRFYGSPEESLQAKELYYLDIPHSDRMQMARA